MKIIEALKSIKDLLKKAEDIRHKISVHCADMEHENPVYGTAAEQTQQISKWLQSHSDVLKEISDLRFRIQKTNVTKQVTMKLGDKDVTKSIAEWIHRRRDLAGLDHAAYKVLASKDAHLPPVGHMKQSNGTVVETKIRRYYDPKVRDEKLELYRSEPSIINGVLEVVNATTDLLE